MKLATTELGKEAEALTIDYRLTVESLEKELEEAIEEAKLATEKLAQARLRLSDPQITKLEKTTQSFIEKGEMVLKNEQTESFLELAENLKNLASGLFSTAAAYEDPRNIDAIKAAIKLRLEREEAEQQARLLAEQQQVTVPLTEDTLDKKPLSIWEKFKNFCGFSTSEVLEGIELTTLSGKHNDLDEHNYDNLEDHSFPVQESVY